MPCPKPQPCLRWASHIHYGAITEAEDLQGSSQGNPVVWRSWCHTHPWAPKSCNSNCPPSSRAEESQGRIRTWQTIVWFLWPSHAAMSSGISSLWKGRDPTLRVRQQEGWPKFPSLLPLPREQAASRTKSHQQGQGHTGADTGLLGCHSGITRERLCEVGFIY